MTITVSQAFMELQKNCEPRAIVDEEVASKHLYLRQTLKNKLNIADDFLIGSYVKNTQIRPRSDIDIFVVLDNSYYIEQTLDTPRKVFSLLLRSLRKTYPLSKIRSDGEAITFQRSRGFNMDIIPSYATNSNEYIIPKQQGQTWISCNPKLHIEHLTHWNKTLNGALKPLIKMTKCWAKVNDVKIKSFHLELLIIEAFRSLSVESQLELCSSYPRAITHIFQQGCILIDEPFYDEVHKRVDTYLDKGNQRTITWNQFRVAADHSTRAWHLQKLKREPMANVYWRKIFKTYSPKGSGS